MRVPALVVLCAAAALAGCASTRIITEPGARIYVDGELVGRGRAEIRRNGMPTTAHVVVKTDDGRKKQLTLKRSFTAGTLAVGALTYGIGLLAFWQHPAGVHISMPKATARTGWDRQKKGGDPWMSPRPVSSGWSSPTTE
ncbi:MAG: hypothetical protein KJO07_12000 [Deltaproteobacteria bacterium]|nr:hypothetical protein [Deltaproteobacteria bacterium]